MHRFRSGRTPAVVSIALLLAALAGCTMDPSFTDSAELLARSTLAFADPMEPTTTVSEVSVALVLESGVEAGTVSTRIVGNNLEVTQAVTGDWVLTAAYLWVGADPAAIPLGGGIAAPGGFPYKAEGLEAGSHTFVIPLGQFFDGELADQTLYIAAHAAVARHENDEVAETQTGWGDGLPIVDGSPGTYFAVTFVSTEHTMVAESAFAYGGEAAVDFRTIDELKPQRWGWTNGPFGPGSHALDLYAGAARSDITRGTLVGTVTVEYDGETAVVTYAADAGFLLTETHLYVGAMLLPSGARGYTVAPGLFPSGGRHAATDQVTYTVDGLSGDVWVVAHAALTVLND